MASQAQKPTEQKLKPKLFSVMKNYTKEQFINASIAIKLALNFFDMGKGDNKEKDKNGED